MFKDLVSLLLTLYIDRSAMYFIPLQGMSLTKLIWPQIYYIILRSLSLSLR